MRGRIVATLLVTAAVVSARGRADEPAANTADDPDTSVPTPPGAASAGEVARLGLLTRLSPLKLKEILTYLAVAGISIYSVAYLYAFVFYNHLSTNPEMVGLTQTTLITRSAVGAAVVALSIAVLGAGLYLAGIIVNVLIAHIHAAGVWAMRKAGLAAHRPKKTDRMPAATPPRGSKTVRIPGTKITTIAVAVCVVGLAVLGLALLAGSDAARVRKGQTESAPQFVAGVGFSEYEATWVGSGVAPFTPSRVAYLGSNGGLVVIYDFTACQTRVLPAGTVAFVGPSATGERWVRSKCH